MKFRKIIAILICIVSLMINESDFEKYRKLKEEYELIAGWNGLWILKGKLILELKKKVQEIFHNAGIEISLDEIFPEQFYI